MASLRVLFGAAKLLPLRSATVFTATKSATFTRSLHISFIQSSPRPSHIVLDATEASSSTPRAKKSSTATKAKTTKKPAKKSTTKASSKKEKPKKKPVKKKVVKKKPVKKAAKPKKKPTPKLMPQPPRGALPYTIFVKENTDRVKEGMLSDGFEKFYMMEFSKRMSQLYRSLTDEEREDLKRRTAIAKQENEEKYQEWLSSLTPEQVDNQNKAIIAKAKTSKKKKYLISHTDRPKKPLTPFILFTRHIQHDPVLSEEVLQGASNALKRSVLMADKWKSLTEEEKQPYQEEYREAFETYKKEYEEYLSRHS